jgi:hypothetical protein
VAWQRGIILFVGVGTVIGTASTAPILYWNKNGWENVGMQISLSIVILLFFFSPLLLGLLYYLAGFLRPRREDG